MRIVASLIFALPILVSAQLRLGTWKNFTDMKSVRAVAMHGSTVWAASGGGFFSVDTLSGVVEQFNNTNGLTSNDLTAIAIAPDGNVWLGAEDGSVDVYDPAAGSWTAIPNIRTSTRLQKSIRSFVIDGDTVFIVADYGISVFKRSRWEFGDTYSGFGFSGQAGVTSLATDGSRLWIGTTVGIAVGNRFDPALTAPTAWTRYTDLGGISVSVFAVASVGSGILVGSGTGAARFTGTSFEAVPLYSGRSVLSIQRVADSYAVLSADATDGRIDILSDPIAPPVSSWNIAGIVPTEMAMSSSGNSPWIATSSKGVGRFGGPDWSFHAPDGPQSNQFISLGVDASGSVWAASGMNGSGKGFYRYDPNRSEGNQWRNFTVSGDSRLIFDDYYKVSVTSDSSVWISSWGRGVIQMKGDSIVRRIHSESTPSLASAVPQDPLYVVPGSVARDPAGQLWIDVRTAANGNHLARMSNDTTFVYYQNQYNSFEGLFQNMVIDQNGTKWLGNSEPSDKKEKGLYFFNEKMLVSGTQTTGGWGYLSSADGLPSNSILALAVDREGDVWIGTDLGAVIITNPLSPRSGRMLAYPVREQSVQTIAVDAVNNKWVGTKEGVFVLSPDGTQLLEQYTVLSTSGQLSDNDVRSIAIDQIRGLVYMGTEKGMSRLQIAQIEPSSVFATLEFSPNPYLIPGDDPVQIRGLVGNSSIKVISVSGSFVAEFHAQGGGRAFWDGRDTKGNLVSSGVYFVVASAENGSLVASGKVAVIRR